MRKEFQLQPGETLEAETRQRLILWIPKFVLAVFWILIPFFFLFGLFREGTVGVVLFFVVLVTGLWYGLFVWLSYSQTKFIVTSDRLVSVKRKGLIQKTVREMPLANIESVAFRVKGASSTILRHGKIRVEPKGNAKKLIVSRLPNPEELKEKISSLIFDKMEEDRFSGDQVK